MPRSSATSFSFGRWSVVHAEPRPRSRGGEHERPRRRQDRAPEPRLHGARHVVDPTVDDGDHHERHPVEVLPEVHRRGAHGVALVVAEVPVGVLRSGALRVDVEVSAVVVRDGAASCRGSSTTTHAHPWLFEPVGACIAISRHSSRTSRSTGRSKSRRLRTDRVVMRTSSADRLRRISAACHRRREGADWRHV